ncbi:uncharacterized protein LOC122510005 [Leptopilina heterotoma]|uniref:uncharacterized protein LOC122510005 n=1 Tax=Leptopilina heterotoma TaxID=63436 RepID=UPI001CA8BC6A|nr:uncharacterized protein LOC122510005 [Leptopilina heterotoma]
MNGRATRSQQLPLEAGLTYPERKRTTDGRPDIKGLYDRLDVIYFDGELADAGYTITWGRQMTSTSGCTDLPQREVRISWEIHRILPVEELIGTLLHEMIHVKLFQHRQDRDSFHHTGAFLEEMDRINTMGPFRADIRHDLPRKVLYQLRPYVWKCRSCKHILRLTDSRKPGLKSFHRVRG